MEKMNDPIEFIVTEEGTANLKVSPKAIDVLKGVNKPLKVVSVVGNYRTGKSFLLNRLMSRNDGFPLGSTVESKTKGIWMWVGDHPGDPSKALLLLDTEGLNDVKKGDRTHDAHIFTLAILLSSILVYNSTGAIGAEALEGLHVASELSKHVQTKQKSGIAFATFFPAFIWAVRDFHLRLQDGNGKQLTENEYLEMSLTVQPGATGNRDFTTVKQAVRDHFPKRDCFTFLPPVSFKKLEQLETLPESELDPDFLEAGEKFTDFVYRCHSFYHLKGEMLTGQSFAILADQYATLINDGSIDLQSAHSNMITSVNSGAIQTVLSKFRDFLETLVFPMSNDAFFNAHTSQREILFKDFQIKCINLGDHMEFKEEFDSKFMDLAKEYHFKNLNSSEAICQHKLSELFLPIASKLEQNGYHKPGGYYDLRKDVDFMEVQYKDFDKQEETGPRYSEARMEFWDKKVAKTIFNKHL